jgi:CheY-like chemotaxis protein
VRSTPAILSGVHVLAVDDEADALALVSELLRAGRRARHSGAISAPEALEQLTPCGPPWLLLADLGMSAHGRISADRAGEKTSEPPRFVSFRRQPHRLRHAPRTAWRCDARRPFNIHLAKPIDPAELVRDRRRAGQAVRIGGSFGEFGVAPSALPCRRFRRRRAASMVAMSIFFIGIIASNARFASSPPAASASVRRAG